jgi:hypothetical protein
MRWRTTAAEERWRTVGARGAIMVLTTTIKKQKSTNEWRQRWRTTMAGKRQGTVVEVKEQLLEDDGS